MGPLRRSVVHERRIPFLVGLGTFYFGPTHTNWGPTIKVPCLVSLTGDMPLQRQATVNSRYWAQASVDGIIDPAAAKLPGSGLPERLLVGRAVIDRNAVDSGHVEFAASSHFS
jgi:hypothetical protein